jgi:hypothetical protein
MSLMTYDANVFGGGYQKGEEKEEMDKIEVKRVKFVQKLGEILVVPNGAFGVNIGFSGGGGGQHFNSGKGGDLFLYTIVIL